MQTPRSLPSLVVGSREGNLLRWDVEVAANCNGEKALPITYEFRMELDRQMAITGFQSK